MPCKGKNGSTMDDASDEVFTYFLCCVCPVKEKRPVLSYYPSDNEFHFAGGYTVKAPDLGFLFPAFDDRAANLYNALFYSRDPAQLHQEFIDAIFHTEPPMSAAEQREAFESVLRDALNDSCSLDVVQAVHEQLSARIAEHKESRALEPLSVSPREISAILRDCRVPEESITAFQKGCGEAFGEGAALNPANLVDTGRFVIKTKEATVAADLAQSILVESRIIAGKPYILIPANSGVEVNGMESRSNK